MEMMKRTGGALATSDEPQPAQPEERYVVDDALWVVPSSNYVDPSPPLETSLFDDPNRLGNAWRLTMSTLKAEARESKEQKRQIEEKARALIEEADRAVAPPNEHQPDRPAEVGQPIAEAKGETPDGLMGRLDRLAQATRRLTLRHG
ncbi:hypothetical protein ACN26Y_25095 [Micromonospora sp. WMMD558]|uniref:hypothetical protein n=1 Tax=unclassified Micromonospora TaxID=2617518 RepID=UPI0012B4E334|nr:hypothetical protein [Micromonospora sp. WMMC415]QGN49229.1 hypothetical protein GKC29_21990 [Micromonospora sp. WMMC415]